MSLPAAIINLLKGLEPDAQFTPKLPLVQSSSGNHYFVKVGSSRETEQYVGEERSLRAIYEAAPVLVPKMISSGFIGPSGDVSDDGAGRPFFISEYKNLGSLSDSAAAELGKRLGTELHRYKSGRGYGFDVPTYCGATRMRNGWHDTWGECFTVKIRDLLQSLKDEGRGKMLVQKGEDVCGKVIPKLLGNLNIEPVLLHGDLWSGNTGVDKQSGQPVIFDPSSFFGHCEFDLAIARIFGGIPRSFFEAYEMAMPRTKPVTEYSLRGDLYELFHYLNHAVLFGGGGYASSAERKMDSLLKWVNS